jgi:hypothetical protein
LIVFDFATITDAGTRQAMSRSAGSGRASVGMGGDAGEVLVDALCQLPLPQIKSPGWAARARF